MTASMNLEELLQQFIGLLQTEKKALIENNGKKVEEIVKEKQSFLEAFQAVTPEDVSEPKMKAYVLAIQEKQETNLMLTKQALQFQEDVLKAISQTVTKSGNTYSKKGTYAAAKQPGLINQSI